MYALVLVFGPFSTHSEMKSVLCQLHRFTEPTCPRLNQRIVYILESWCLPQFSRAATIARNLKWLKQSGLAFKSPGRLCPDHWKRNNGSLNWWIYIISITFSTFSSPSQLAQPKAQIETEPARMRLDFHFLGGKCKVAMQWNNCSVTTNDNISWKDCPTPPNMFPWLVRSEQHTHLHYFCFV